MTDCFLCGRSCKIERMPVDIYGDFQKVECDVCGMYEIGSQAQLMINAAHKWFLSALAREFSEFGKPPLRITAENVKSLNEISIIDSPQEKADKILLYLEKKGKYSVGIDYRTDYPVAYAKEKDEFRYYLDELVRKGLITQTTSPKSSYPVYSLTMDAWPRIEELKRQKPEGNRCFVAMWFDESMDDAWKNGFSKIEEETGYKPIRVDFVKHNEKICDIIIAEIRKSSLLIADISGERSGVFFEAGFAKGLGIPVIWTCNKSYEDKIKEHFDTRQYRHIVWKDYSDLKKQIIDCINANFPLKK